MTSRFYTKPLVCISFDTTGSAVILGRAESIPRANLPSRSFEDTLVRAIEEAHPSIQAYIRYSSHAPLITMSRTAEKACGLDESEMEEFVRKTISQMGE